MKTNLSHIKPVELRHLIRKGIFTKPTSGLCPGFTQVNLVIIPSDLAYDFLLFTQRNPRPCPILEVADIGSRKLHYLAQDIDLANDFPKYNIYQYGKLTKTCQSVGNIWQKNFISFLIGCSFSFESELISSGIEVRNITEHVNVPMYKTNIPLRKAGPFQGKMVVSMRPIPEKQVPKVVQVTANMPKVHGAPIQIGDPSSIGINSLIRPDYGDPVTIKDGEIPVFWPCGVTPQNVIMNVKPSLVITHTPGHMLVTDIVNETLKY